MHRSDKNIHIMDYLDAKFSNTKVKIDFYLETYYTKEPGIRTLENYDDSDDDSDVDDDVTNFNKKDVIADLIQKFSPCLEMSKAKCRVLYPNVRFHYIDIRTTLGIGNSCMFIWQYMLNLEHWINHTDPHLKLLSDQISIPSLTSYMMGYLEVRNVKKRWESIKAEMTTYQHKKYNGYDWPWKDSSIAESTMNVNKVKKQVENVKDPRIRNLIKKYYEDMVGNAITRYKNNQKDLEKTFTTALLTIKLSIIADLGGYIVDAYTLGRIFRNYDGDQTWDSFSEVLMYVGENHSKNYHLFITQYLGHDDYVESTKSSYRCVKEIVPEKDATN